MEATRGGAWKLMEVGNGVALSSGDVALECALLKNTGLPTCSTLGEQPVGVWQWEA